MDATNPSSAADAENRIFRNGASGAGPGGKGGKGAKAAKGAKGGKPSGGKPAKREKKIDPDNPFAAALAGLKGD